MAEASVWWVYVVRRADGALYTGIATDVVRRLAQHAAGVGAKALRGRGPLRLVLRGRVGDRGHALRVERRIKALAKDAKEGLVRGRAGIARVIAEEEARCRTRSDSSTAARARS